MSWSSRLKQKLTMAPPSGRKHRSRAPRHPALYRAVESLESRLLLAGEVFLPASNTILETDLRSLTVHDVNQDFDADLILTEGSSGAVEILTGDGYGNFNVAHTISAGDTVVALAVGDFNSDQTDDLAVVDSGLGRISLLAGNGLGDFAPTGTFSTGVGAASVATGNFGGVAGPDLAVANTGAGTISILKSSSSVVFDPAIQIPVGGSPVYVVAGDVNGDTHDDLAVADTLAGTVRIFLGDGTGAFAPGGTYFPDEAPTVLALRNIVGDAKPDLISGGTGSISIFTNNGTGQFTETQTFGIGSTVTAIDFADFDSNGHDDIITANKGSGGVSLLWGLAGDNYIGPFSFSQSIGNIQGIGTGFLDHDGLLDYAVTTDTGEEQVFTQQSVIPPDVIGQVINNQGALVLNADMATFTDPIPGLPLSEYSAVIDWGDGSGLSPAAITPGSGAQMIVVGSHQYPAISDFTAKVIVSHVGGRYGTATTDVSISTAPLTIAGINLAGFPQQALTGVPVAVITDPNLVLVAGDITATIDWGDGTITPGTVSGAAGAFAVVGDHTYAAAGNYQVHVHAVANQTQLDATTTAQILDSIVGTAVPINALSTVPFVNVPIAFFADTQPSTLASEYTATIDWGDGQPSSAGVITAVAGAFQVAGSHTYAQPGTYPVSIHMQHTSGRATTLQTTANVQNGSLQVTGLDVVAIKMVPLTAVPVALITDVGSAASDFSALIQWGDNTQSAGTIVSLGAGTFQVVGTHTYSATGTFDISVQINHTDGRTATATSVAAVQDNALILAPVAVLATAGQLLLNVPVGTVFDPVPGTSAVVFVVTIDWGDGTPLDAGSIQGLGNGLFQLRGTHVYASAGNFNFTIQVSHTDGRTASAIGLAVVQNSAINAIGIDVAGFQSVPLQSVPVAAFSVADTNAVASDFTANITWGDGGQSAGTIVQLAPGSFQVRGSHTYATSDSFPLSVGISGTGGRSATATATAVISPDTIVAAGGSFSAAAGVQVTDVPIGSFVDPVPSTAADYTVLINWGDNTQSTAGTVAAFGGGFAVSGTHTFAQAGVFSVTFQISHRDGRTASATATANVSAGNLIATGLSLQGQTGVAFSGIVATVLDLQPGTQATDLTATIVWGDGTSPSSGTVALLSGNTFSISGSHTYAQAGAFSIVVSINHTDGRSTTANSDINVQSPALTASGVSLSAQVGVPLANVTVATFSDELLSSVVADFTASIAWGDGTVTAGVVQSLGQGAFVVRGTHTYADTLTGIIGITISHTDGRATSTGSPIVVSLPQIASQGLNISPALGTSTGSIAVATFTDAKPGATAADYQATIDWGDGTTPTAGTITLGAGGVFTVAGTHSYAQAGDFTLTVSISSTADGRNDVASGIASVSAQPLVTNGINVVALAGIGIKRVRVATFRDPLGAGEGNFSALIDWGDGDSSTGAINVNVNGTFIVRGSHVYRQSGHFTVQVHIADGASPRGTAQSTARVGRAARIALPRTLNPAANRALSGVVFAFLDPNPLARANDFTATIDWGDGDSSDAQVRRRGGLFEVLANHTYGHSRRFTIAFSISDTGGVGFTFRQRVVVR